MLRPVFYVRSTLLISLYTLTMLRFTLSSYSIVSTAFRLVRGEGADRSNATERISHYISLRCERYTAALETELPSLPCNSIYASLRQQNRFITTFYAACLYVIMSTHSRQTYSTHWSRTRHTAHTCISQR